MPRAQLSHGSFASPKTFFVPFVNPSWLKLSGITRDSVGAPLGNCTVKLFNASNDVIVNTTISDANGVYSFDVAHTVMFYIRAYSADGLVVGSSLNTLVGT